MNATTTREIFGVKLDIVELEEKWKVNTPQFKKWFRDTFKGEFCGFVWIDLSKKSPLDPEFTNVDIRDEQNMGMSVEDMQYSYRAYKFIEPTPGSGKFFPLVDLNSEFDDGRTRVLAAMEEYESGNQEARWMLAGMIKKPDNNLISKMSTGFCANIFPPQVGLKPKDLIRGGIKLVKKGELKRNKTDIEFWLVNRCNIYQKYPNNAGGWVTQIVNRIYDNSDNIDFSVTRKLDDSQWKNWLRNSPDLVDVHGRKLNIGEIILYKVPSNSNEARLVYRLLERAEKKKHTYVGLYCTEDFDAKTMRRQFEEFIGNIDKSHGRMISYANNAVSISGINLNEMDDKKAYTFFLLPCMVGDHDEAYRNYRLFTKLEDF